MPWWLGTGSGASHPAHFPSSACMSMSLARPLIWLWRPLCCVVYGQCVADAWH